MANVFDLSDVWNDATKAFAAIRMNVTNTASAAGSLLLDLQVGGVSLFRVDKDGRAVMKDPAFTAITFATGWTSQSTYNAAYPVAGYAKTAEGEVVLKGTANNGPGGGTTLICTLPAGFRPTGDRIFIVMGGAGFDTPNFVSVAADGAVTVYSGSAASSPVGLDQIRFFP